MDKEQLAREVAEQVQRIAATSPEDYAILICLAYHKRLEELGYVIEKKREFERIEKDRAQMGKYICGYQQICRENDCAPSSGELLEAMKRFDERTKHK